MLIIMCGYLTTQSISQVYYPDGVSTQLSILCNFEYCNFVVVVPPSPEVHAVVAMEIKQPGSYIVLATAKV